jgi:hypothetical protein
MPPAELRVFPVQTKKHFRQFLALPYRLYRGDKNWVPPLYLERREALHPKKNPFYHHAEVQLFLAQRGKEIVGRISAQLDREYEKRYGEKLGQFGFFECENDPEAAQALLNAAESFARNHGASRCMGPFSFSTNEECGLLVSGFESPLMTMMPYNPPFYADLLELCGYQKAKDLFAWHYSTDEIPPEAAKVARDVAQYPGLKLRSIDLKHFERDIQIIFEVYTSAWSENWGFVPLTAEELKKTAKDLKHFIDPDGALIAELEGRPIAICVAVPNLYDLIAGLKGRLFPFGFVRLLWRIKRRKYKSGRLMLLGIAKEQQGSMLGGFLSVLLYVEIQKICRDRGFRWGELSWTLEDNHKINSGIEFMGGKRYKTMRIYEKNLEEG